MAIYYTQKERDALQNIYDNVFSSFLSFQEFKKLFDYKLIETKKSSKIISDMFVYVFVKYGFSKSVLKDFAIACKLSKKTRSRCDVLLNTIFEMSELKKQLEKTNTENNEEL
jgi:hypothetical protein